MRQTVNTHHTMRLFVRILIRSVGNLGLLVFFVYAFHLAKRSFGPRRKVLSRQYRKSAISDFSPDASPSLSKLASEVAVDAEARIHRSLTGCGSEEPTTTVSRLHSASKRMPNAIAFMDYTVRNGAMVWRESVTWQQYYLRSLHIAHDLISTHNFAKHDVALFVSESRPEFFLAWMGVQMCGGICSAAHAWSSLEELDQVVRTVSPKVCFVDRLDLVQHFASTSIVVMHLDTAAKTWGEATPTEDVSIVKQRIREIRPGHASQILFSSGQHLGVTKPYLLSHDNVTFSARAFLQHHENTSRWGHPHPLDQQHLLQQSSHEHICSFLPLSHVGSLVIDLHVPMCITASQSYKTACTVWTLHKQGSDGLTNLLFTALEEIRPTLFLGMPAVWDRIRRALQANTNNALTKFALDTGKQWFTAVQAGQHGTEPVALYYAERFVLNKIKRKLGLDRCKLLMSSGAPIARKQLEYFGSLGLHIMESFGATGCSGPQCMGRQDYFICGNVGVSLPSCELKLERVDELEDGGEICVRGRHVCMGVLNDAETTNRVIDSEGFFRTNHLGRLDRFGCLELIGRRDELVGVEKGKLLGLNQIEAILRERARPLVDRVVVVSIERGSVLRVFVTLRQPVASKSEPPPLTGPALWKQIQCAVDEVNTALKGVCEIEHFYVLPQTIKFTSFGTEAELTHSGQARRSVVKQKYQNELRVLTSKGFSSKSQQ